MPRFVDRVYSATNQNENWELRDIILDRLVEFMKKEYPVEPFHPVMAQHADFKTGIRVKLTEAFPPKAGKKRVEVSVETHWERRTRG